MPLGRSSGGGCWPELGGARSDLDGLRCLPPSVEEIATDLACSSEISISSDGCDSVSALHISLLRLLLLQEREPMQMAAEEDEDDEEEEEEKGMEAGEAERRRVGAATGDAPRRGWPLCLSGCLCDALPLLDAHCWPELLRLLLDTWAQRRSQTTGAGEEQEEEFGAESEELGDHDERGGSSTAAGAMGRSGDEGTREAAKGLSLIHI